MGQPENITKRTLNNSIINLSGFLISLTVSFLLIPYIIDNIGLSKYGIYGLFIALLGPLGITSLGFNQAGIKFISDFHTKGDFKNLNRYFQTLLSLVILIGIIGALLIYLFGFKIIIYFFQIDTNDYSTIKNSLNYVAIMWLIGQINSSLTIIPTSHQRYKLLTIGNVSLVLLNALFTILFIDSGLEGLLRAYCLGNFSILFVWLIIIKKLSPTLKYKFLIDKIALKNCFSFSSWQTLGQIGSIFNSQAEKYMFAAFFNTFSLGVYNVVHDVHAKLYMPIYKLFEVLFPLFSSMDNERNRNPRDTILLKSTWFVNILSSVIMLSFLPIIRPFLTIWIGEDVIPVGTPILTALIIAAGISACSIPVILYYTSKGHTKFLAFTSLISSLIGMVITYFLLDYYGVKYAGYGAIFSFFIRHLVYILRIRNSIQSINRILIFNASALPFSSALILNLALMNYYPTNPDNWFSLIGVYIIYIIFTIIWIILVTFIFDDFKTRRKDILTLWRKTRNK